MESIKIDVTGNIARVIDKPSRITSGTVGLPVEFTFDSQWEGLSKTAVFKAGCVQKNYEGLVAETIVPWELLEKPGVWLSIGVYGVNADGSVAIPTIWANVCAIQVGVNPDGDPGTDPTLPIWQKLLDAIGDLTALDTKAAENLVVAINDAYDMAKNGGLNTDPTLTVEGTAADAKATGDAIAEAKQDAANAQTAAENAHLAVEEETTAREQAIANEAEAREQAITNEAEAREQAITNEANTRASAYNDLLSALNTHTANQSNPHKVTRAQIYAAPDGNGLGTTALSSVMTLDDLFTNGWYEYWGDSILDNPNLSKGLVFVQGWSDYGTIKTARQTFYPSYIGVGYITREYGFDMNTEEYVWGEWEWVNPQLATAEEYRTTKRWQGKPVYTKLVSLGSVTNGASVVWNALSNVIPLRWDSHFYAQSLPKYNSASSYFFVHLAANKAEISCAGWTAQPVAITVDYVYSN